MIRSNIFISDCNSHTCLKIYSGMTLGDILDALRAAVGRNDLESVMVESNLVCIAGQPWTNYKNVMRDHLRVRFELDTSRCITCTHPSTTSPEGRKEHQRTGLCEACWDALAPRDAAGRDRCDRLRSETACYNFVSDWIAQSRVKDGGSITTTADNARRIVAIAAGLESLPDVWEPGLRPAP